MFLCAALGAVEKNEDDGVETSLEVQNEPNDSKYTKSLLCLYFSLIISQFRNNICFCLQLNKAKTMVLKIGHQTSKAIRILVNG